VASHRKIRVLISGLPGIACETYESSFVALKISMSYVELQQYQRESYRESEAQIVQVFFEELNDMLAAGFAVRNVDALGCASCNINHLMKGCMLKRL
jgi:hypothetical protein